MTLWFRSIMSIGVSLSMLEPSLLWAASDPASARARAATIAVADLRVDDSMETSTTQRLEAGFREGLERSRADATIVDITVAGCMEASCFAQRLADTPAATLVRASVEHHQRDFILQVEARDRQGKIVVRTHEVCEICGVDEVVEVLASASARVFDQVLGRPTLSVLHLDTVPSGAFVLLEGQELGATPLTVALDAGKHTLSFDKHGYRTETQIVEMERGLETTATVRLLSVGKRDTTTITGGVFVGLGIAGIATGIALVAIDGRTDRNRCTTPDPDPDPEPAPGPGPGPMPMPMPMPPPGPEPECPTYETKWGGLAAGVAGAALLGAGITLLVHRQVRRRTKVAFGPGSLSVFGRF